MAHDAVKARVAAALTGVVNPRVGTDVISAGTVAGIDVTPDGKVRLAVLLRREDPASLAREIRSALQGVEGVTGVKLDIRDPVSGTGPSHPPPSQGSVERAPTTPKATPAPSARQLPHLGRIVAISSGKGGVGKSTVAANLAVALAFAGHRVGLMDGDIYGPNIPRMFGVVGQQPLVVGGKIQPVEAHGVKLISLGSIVERDTAAIWRGPIIQKIIQQFVNDVEWGQLDYLLVDLPPGTGDAQLSLVQSVNLDGALIVTTPQEVAVGDALRGAKMFEKVGVPVLGIVENMSYFACPHCGERTAIFASGGGKRLAEELGLELLAEIPLQAGMPDLSETGVPVVVGEPGSAAARALSDLAKAVVQQVSGQSVRLPVIVD
ncbi:MAG: Mrp/NBP35 family ATP-binding protein [Gemmatimonadota bacterium]